MPHETEAVIRDIIARTNAAVIVNYLMTRKPEDMAIDIMEAQRTKEEIAAIATTLTKGK